MFVTPPVDAWATVGGIETTYPATYHTTRAAATTVPKSALTIRVERLIETLPSDRAPQCSTPAGRRSSRCHRPVMSRRGDGGVCLTQPCEYCWSRTSR